MNITIINNGTSYLGELHDLLNSHNIDIQSWDSGFNVHPDTDLTILSGGHLNLVGNEEYYEEEIKFVTHYTKPLLGICLGAELLAYAYGAKLSRLQEKQYGVYVIEKLLNDRLFHEMNKFGVYENHRWIIKELPEKFIGLAKSTNGYEIIKHKQLPLYGFQFHPEMMADKTCGTQLFSNLIGIVEH